MLFFSLLIESLNTHHTDFIKMSFKFEIEILSGRETFATALISGCQIILLREQASELNCF